MPETSAPNAGSRPDERGQLAYTVLLAATWLTAGHAVLLGYAVYRLVRIPSPSDLGGWGMTATTGWFFLSLPLGLLVIVLRKRLLRLAPGALAGLATLTVILALAAFAAYSLELARL